MLNTKNFFMAALRQAKQSAMLAAVVLLMSAPLSADVIDFENMPQTYWYFAGQQNFGNYWEGVTFGPGATILENEVYGYNDTDYPPHSGHAVLFSISLGYIDAVLDVPVDNVSIWYSANSNFFLEAYDEFDNLIDTAVGGANLNTNSFLEVTSGSSNIKWVRMHDTGNYFSIDDFQAPFVSGDPLVPEPSTILLALMPAIALWCRGRRAAR